MKVAAGIFFYSISSKRYLYLLRSIEKNWSLPGGKMESDETIYDGLKRECLEEIGFFKSDLKFIPIQKFINYDFTYHTFFCGINQEFIPILNNEHCGYAWVEEVFYPKPLHPGLFNTITFDIVKNKLKSLTESYYKLATVATGYNDPAGGVELAAPKVNI
jgi:8-oxo-dGTP pyrophosphatase MutT (NUDIX family)